ncbi:MAG: RNA polymerase sigma factor [Blautia sp.]|nr:RNA polymerase sigma factor [Blautia sp.]
MSMDPEEQYDKIYRYCYFKLHHRETAEDITQETFLRYFRNYGRASGEQALKRLYVIARNLCIDEYRRRSLSPLDESMPEPPKEEQLLTTLTVRAALSELGQEEQELLLLRYVNEVPVSAIGRMLGISRFAAHRRIQAAVRKLKEKLGKEPF